MTKIIVLNSGLCVFRALVKRRNRGVFAHALIKKRKYWPKHVKGDDIKAHFEGHEVGTANTIKGTHDQFPFHAFAMKGHDFIMSTYGINEKNVRYQTLQVYIKKR